LTVRVAVGDQDEPDGWSAFASALVSDPSPADR
jgi:hypothetical protein